jgi:hypothetical protein
MAESKYEKYIIRHPARGKPGAVPLPAEKVGRIDPPYAFLGGGRQIKGLDHMVEYLWIWKEYATGITPEKPPHKHDCEEIFLYLGTNKENPDDFGAEIDFWIGEGSESEKLSFNTSSLIYVPPNVVHTPIIYKKVNRPILLIIFSSDAGDLASKVIKCPLREI